MNDVTIYEQKIDYLKVINNCLARKDWGKTFTIYAYKDLRVTFLMTSYNFESNVATFKIEVLHKNYDFMFTKNKFVEVFMNNFSVEDIHRLVGCSIVKILRGLHEEREKRIAETVHKELKYHRYALVDEDFERAGLLDEWEDAQEISNDEFRKLAEDTVIDHAENILNQDFRVEVARYVREAPMIEEFETIMDKIGVDE